jgi:hypothetical protein
LFVFKGFVDVLDYAVGLFDGGVTLRKPNWWAGIRLLESTNGRMRCRRIFSKTLETISQKMAT